MPTLAFRTIIESAAATAAVAILWARRAWLAAKILWVVGEAWCFTRRFKTKKEKRMNVELVANSEAVAQQFGIKETTEVIDLGLALGNGVFQSLQDDGKITFGDVPKFGPALLAVAPAIEGVTQVPFELKELSDSELEQIRAHVQAKLPEIGDRWFVVATESLNIGMSAFRMYKAFQVPKA